MKEKTEENLVELNIKNSEEFIEFILSKSKIDYVYSREIAYKRDSTKISHVIPRFERSLQLAGSNIAYHNSSAMATSFYNEGRLTIKPTLLQSRAGLVNKDLCSYDVSYVDLTEAKKRSFKEIVSKIIDKREFESSKGIIPLVLRSQLHFHFDGWRLYIL